MKKIITSIITLFFINIIVLFANEKDETISAKNWIFQRSIEVNKLIDSCIKKNDSKCLVIIDKSIKEPYYSLLITRSSYIIGILIINNKTTNELIFIDEFKRFKPIQITDTIKVDSLEKTALCYSEICGNEEYFAIHIGMTAFSLIYFEDKHSYLYTLDNDIYPINCESQEKLKGRVFYKNYFRNILFKYASTSYLR